MDQLVKYAKEFITKPGNEWLHLYIAEACDSQILLSQDYDALSIEEPQLLSENDSDGSVQNGFRFFFSTFISL